MPLEKQPRVFIATHMPKVFWLYWANMVNVEVPKKYSEKTKLLKEIERRFKIIERVTEYHLM